MNDKERRRAVFLKQGIALWEKQVIIQQKRALEKRKKEREDELQQSAGLREEGRVCNGKPQGHKGGQGTVRSNHTIRFAQIGAALRERSEEVRGQELGEGPAVKPVSGLRPKTRKQDSNGNDR